MSRSPSRMSPRCRMAPRSSALARLRLAARCERSSTTSTSSPRSSRASTRFDPMKPAPPVTRARIGARILRRGARRVGAADATPAPWRTARRARDDRLGRRQRAHARQSRVPRARVAPPCGGGRGQPGHVAGRARGRRGRPARPTAPAAVATTGRPAAIASAAARPNVSAERDGTTATRRPRRAASRAPSSPTRPAKRTPAARRGGRRSQQRPLSGPVAGDDERQAGRAARVDRDVDALLAARAATTTSAWRPSSARRAVGDRPHDVARRRATRPGSSGAPSSRRRSRANALGTTTTSACSTSRRCHSASAAA